MSPEKNAPIRVLIVDDSFFMRKILAEMLADSAGAITVVDSAQNGLEALEKNRDLKPDVITLDVEMPKMDGLTALSRIMRENPTPVIMLSSHTGKGTETTIRALELGAIDCVGKPSGKLLENIRMIQAELIEKIKVASLCRMNYKKSGLTPLLDEAPAAKKEKRSEPEPPKITALKPATFLVAVGSSTGGPRALNAFFSKLEPHPSAAFIIVQHISVGFTKALAKRLDEVSDLKVTEAEEGEYLMGGQAYVAPAGSHLVVAGASGCYRVAFNDLPPRLGVKPSADLMMQSVAKAAAGRCLGVVLTGMGKDGTEGLKEIKKAGGRTFAQDAESCVVYGMPKAAVDAGVVDSQMALVPMALEINSFLNRQKKT